MGRAVKNTMALSAAELISKVLNFAFVAVLARQLRPDDFGGYTTVMTLVWFMGPLADLGVSYILVREIAADRTRAAHLLPNALAVTVGTACIAWALLVGIALLARYPDPLRPLIALAGLSVVGNTLMQTAGSALRGFERMEIQAILTSSLLLASSTVGIGLALAGLGLSVQVMIVVLASLTGAAITVVIVHWYFVPLRWTFDIGVCCSLVSQAWPAALMFMYGIVLRWIDVLILGQVRNMNEVAIYGAASKIIDIASVFSTSAALALFPVLSLRWRESISATRVLYARALRFFVAFGLATAVGLTLLADSIVVVAFGMAYGPSAVPLRWLGWAFFFQVTAGPMGMLLIAAGDRLKQFMPVLGGVVLGNIVLNLLLAPRLGYLGASIAYVLTTLAILAGNEWAASVYFDPAPHVTSVLLKPALAGLAMGIGWWMWRPASLLVSAPLGAAIFIGTLAVLGEWKEEPYRTLLALVETTLRQKRWGWKGESG